MNPSSFPSLSRQQDCRGVRDRARMVSLDAGNFGIPSQSAAVYQKFYVDRKSFMQMLLRHSRNDRTQ